RQMFGNATDMLGAAVSQADRDQTTLRGTFRLGMEMSPALIPFVELGYGRTWRDEEIDFSGLRRSGDEMRASVGVAVNLSEKLNGEFSVGWLRQTFDDATLPDVDGLRWTAALNWSPQVGTTVNAGLTTSIDGGSGGGGGSLLYSGTAGITHEFSSRLTGTATFGLALRDYAASSQNDVTLSGEVGATYWFNRMVGINGRARHESVMSDDPLRETDTTTLLLGLRLQR
ncbi:MAG: outer membrane beta-barrel protein, partial [Phyllobacteriaceae bacterium]|nr:outer membrane beta-barrel protein [Phyllobacteriaceae bacterium]